MACTLPVVGIATKSLTNHSFLQSVGEYPDWGKMRFVEYPAKPWAEILEGASTLAIELVSRLVQYEGSRRMTAAQVCNSFKFLVNSPIMGAEDDRPLITLSSKI